MNAHAWIIATALGFLPEEDFDDENFFEGMPGPQEGILKRVLFIELENDMDTLSAAISLACLTYGFPVPDTLDLLSALDIPFPLLGNDGNLIDALRTIGDERGYDVVWASGAGSEPDKTLHYTLGHPSDYEGFYPDESNPRACPHA